MVERPGAALATRPAGRGHHRAGAAAFPRHQLLAPLFGLHRRLAKLAAAEHFFNRRHSLDSEPDVVADYLPDGMERLATARTLATREPPGRERSFAFSRLAPAPAPRTHPPRSPS